MIITYANVILFVLMSKNPSSPYLKKSVITQVDTVQS